MSSSGASGGVITVGQVTQVVRRGWTVVLTCVLVGVALAGALFVASPVEYTSRAVVSLSPPLLMTGSSTSKDISTPTEIAIMTSTAVADRAAPLLNWTTGSANLLNHVSVSSPLDSQVLEIKYSESTPKAAAAGANAFATAYLAYRTDTAQAELQARVDRIAQRTASLQKAADAQLLIAADPKSSGATKATARAQQSLALRLINQLRDQQAAIETTTVTAGHFVDRGLPPIVRTYPRLPVFLLGGLLIGLVIGIALVMLRSLRDTRVRDAGAVESRFNVPVLASVPVPTHRQVESGGLGVLTDIGGPEADAYRSLAAKLTTGDSEFCRRVLFVAAGEFHATTTPISMAVTLAAQGKKVILLGSRGAMINACRLVSPEDATVNVIHEGLQQLLHVGGLRLISFGDEVILDAAFRRLGDELGPLLSEVDILLVDGVNIELASTPLTLAKLADEALVLVGTGETHTHDVRATLHELVQVALPATGFILVEPTWRRGSHGRARMANGWLTSLEDQESLSSQR